MPCAKCSLLLAEYARRYGTYRAAFNALAERVEAAPIAEYNVLRIARDDARIDSELARVELERHQQEHVTGIAYSS
jgi:hypothetical protein